MITGDDWVMAKKKSSGFEAPTIGTIHPDGSKIRHLPNGRIEIVPPDKKDDKKKK